MAIKGSADKPEPGGDGWEVWGGELIMPAGYTEGGAPYGMTAADFRSMTRQFARGAGWARAKWVLEEIARMGAEPGDEVRVGQVTKIGKGLSRGVFRAEVQVRPGRKDLSGDFVVLVPRVDAEAGLEGRVRKELQLLNVLSGLPLPFRVPKPLGALPESERLAMVRQFLPGIPLDPRAGRQKSVRPWVVLGRVAAAVHAIDPGLVEGFLPGHKTWRDHARSELSVLEGLDEPEVREARAWAEEHLPPAEPSRLLHGDLLGQNILLDLFSEKPLPEETVGVIDWEHACRGDPAYDLAIMTRCVRQPFQVASGLERLLMAYAAGARIPPAVEHIRLYELCLAGRWYREALSRKGEGGEPPTEALGRLRRVLRMARAPQSTRPGSFSGSVRRDARS